MEFTNCKKTIEVKIIDLDSRQDVSEELLSIYNKYYRETIDGVLVVPDEELEVLSDEKELKELAMREWEWTQEFLETVVINITVKEV